LPTGTPSIRSPTRERQREEIMTMNSNTVSVLEGNTFVVGRRNGDVDAGPL